MRVVLDLFHMLVAVAEFVLDGLFAGQDGKRRPVETMGFQGEDGGVERVRGIKRSYNFPNRL